jgi:lysophospholipase L1-like esterase
VPSSQCPPLLLDTFDATLKAAKLDKHEGHGAYRTDQIAGNLLGVVPGSNVSSNNGGHWLDGTASRPAIYPQVVLLHIGTNDILQKVAPSVAAANLDQTLKTLTDARPNAKVFVSTIIPMQDAAKMPALKTYNQLLKDVVAKYKTAGKKVVLVDMYAQFVDASGNVRTGLYSDPVHPNRAGYDKIGDVFAAAVMANR